MLCFVPTGVKAVPMVTTTVPEGMRNSLYIASSITRRMEAEAASDRTLPSVDKVVITRLSARNRINLDSGRLNNIVWDDPLLGVIHFRRSLEISQLEVVRKSNELEWYPNGRLGEHATVHTDAGHDPLVMLRNFLSRFSLCPRVIKRRAPNRMQSTERAGMASDPLPSGRAVLRAWTGRPCRKRPLMAEEPHLNKARDCAHQSRLLISVIQARSV